jgi:hypothetical protein
MLTYVVDEQLGILVAHNRPGPSAGQETLLRASRELGACPPVRGRAKLALVLSDPGAPYASPAQRSAMLEAWSEHETYPTLAVVTQSTVTRALFKVLPLMSSGRLTKDNCRAFDRRDEAVDWLCTLRPEARSALERMMEACGASAGSRS